MTQPNPNDTKFEQQQSDSAVAGLKNQVEDNFDNNSEKSNDLTADAIADNVAQQKSN